jgi:hypothetical protein
MEAARVALEQELARLERIARSMVAAGCSPPPAI